MSYLQRLREKHKAQQQENEIDAQNDFKAQQEQSTSSQIVIAHQDANKTVCNVDSPQDLGMVKCKACLHWNYSQCRHKHYGSADPERWRRCKGYES